MAFAKDYREEITLAYYCFSLALTVAAFIFGTIYLRHRDRRDQQRREWRQFAERIYSDYSKLKDEDVTRKISKVRDTFRNIPIKSSITGLDVLRYMLADANYERSKTSQLESLRADLQSIFPLFNVCSSLIFLGKIPKNIKEELRDVVTELGKIAVPFFTGKRREIILKCLEHFGSCRPKRETERRVDAKLEETIPYVKSCLRFEFGRPDSLLDGPQLDFDDSFYGLTARPYANCGNEGGRDYSQWSNFLINNNMSSPSNLGRPDNLLDGPQLDFDDLLYGPMARPYARCGNEGGGDYSQCSNFSINNSSSPSNLQRLLEADSLTHLQTILQEPRYKADFERKLQRHPVPLVFDTKLSDIDGQEPVLVKVLHEVRVYIHLCLTDQLEKHSKVGRIKENMMRLGDLEEEVTMVRDTVAVVKGISDRFIEGLKGIQKSHSHCYNRNFCEELKQLYEQWQKIQIIKDGISKEIQVPEREDKKVQMPEREDKEIQVQFPYEDKEIQVQNEDEEIQVQYEDKEIQVSEYEDEEIIVLHESVV